MPREGKQPGQSRDPDDANRQVSAQVIVRSQSGKRFHGDVPITVKNIEEYAPSLEDAKATEAGFRAAGFDVGETVGISFSITAPRARFEQFFGERLSIDDRGAIARAGSQAPPGGLELSLSQLPDDLARLVIAVVFTPPAELHDTNGLAFGEPQPEGG